MTDHSLLHKRWIRSRKGYSGLIATIFMVLVVLYLYFNVFMFIQSRNVAFQDVTSQSQQLDIDRSMERVRISDVTYPVGRIALTIKNIGPLPVQLVRMWVHNSEGEYTTLRFSPPIILHSGSEIPLNFPIGIDGASTGEIIFWFVTARGNLVSTNTN